MSKTTPETPETPETPAVAPVPAKPVFDPIENHPDLLKRIQDPSGSRTRVAPDSQVWVDGYNAYGRPCKIPI